jgi:hypothetical protein
MSLEAWRGTDHPTVNSRLPDDAPCHRTREQALDPTHLGEDRGPDVAYKQIPLVALCVPDPCCDMLFRQGHWRFDIK